MKKLGLVPIVLGLFTLAGCANPSPLAPAAAAGGAGELSAKPSAATPGVYTLTFMARRGRDAAGGDEPSGPDRRTDPEGRP